MIFAMEDKFVKIFKKVYSDYYMMHSDASTLPKENLYYLHRQWFFPNHIDIVLEKIVSFQKKYYPNSNLAVCLFAGLLHDVGLIYKRGSKDPIGHENRSVEFTKMKLVEEGLDQDFVDKVCICIEATDADSAPESEEAIIVRNADAYSHLTSIHFIAKAYFTQELESYIQWFAKKIESTFKKLTIEELMSEVRPMAEKYKAMIDLYTANKNKSFVDNLN